MAATDARRDEAAALLDGREAVLREIREDEVIELARDLVRIPSFTTEETPVARFLARYLEAQGIEAELSPVEEGRLQVIGRVREDGGAGDGPSLLFDGHLDIDPIARGWKRNPFHPVVSAPAAALVSYAVVYRVAGWITGGRLRGGAARGTPE